MARKYDGYCQCCGKFVDNGTRLDDGDHFINEWLCYQCGHQLLLPSPGIYGHGSSEF